MELVQFEKWSPDCGTCTNPNDKRNQMSDNEKLRTCRGLGSFCAILQNRLVTVKAIEEKNDDIIRIIENRPSKDQIEVTSLHSTKRKNLLVPTFRIQSFARKNVGMLNVSFWPLPNWHKTKTWGMYLKLFPADFQGFM